MLSRLDRPPACGVNQGSKNHVIRVRLLLLLSEHLFLLKSALCPSTLIKNIFLFKTYCFLKLILIEISTWMDHFALLNTYPSTGIDNVVRCHQIFFHFDFFN
jgi:hypothetical protein